MPGATATPEAAQSAAPSANPMPAASAQPVEADKGAFYFGGQGNYSNYIFTGAAIALPRSTIENGFFVRALFNTGGYNYISDTLGQVKANFTGGELDAFYSFTHPNFWNAIGAGAAYDNTALRPYDPSNRRAGGTTELRLSMDGGIVGGPVRAEWDGFYGTYLDDYAARLGVTHDISSIVRLGGEVYTEGDPTYHLNEIGPYVGIQITPKASLELGGGWSWQSGFAGRNYVKLSFFQKF